MRNALISALFLVACARASEPAVSIPPTVAAAVSPGASTIVSMPTNEAYDDASHADMCVVPHDNYLEIDQQTKRQDALMFGTCADFTVQFYKDMSRGCERAAPSLAKAMGIAAEKLEDPSPRQGDRSAEVSRTLMEAASPLLPARCMPDSGSWKLLEDDWGRTIGEVSLSYRDERACQPDHELFVFTTDDHRTGAYYDMAFVDSGVHYLALALRPHLDPLAIQMLRKVLFCSIIGNQGGDYWRPRLKADPTRIPRPPLAPAQDP
jgi:hypothetical protein